MNKPVDIPRRQRLRCRGRAVSAHPQSGQALRRFRRAAKTFRSTSARANSSAFSGRPAAARPRFCARSRGSIRRTKARSKWAAAMSRACRRPNAISASCFNPMRCFRTSRWRPISAMAWSIAGGPRSEIKARVKELLTLVGLARSGNQISGATLRRTAAARRAGACACDIARVAAARRAALRARCARAAAAARPDQGSAAPARRHHHHGHARPGRGDVDGRPHRGDEPGRDRPGRRAVRDLSRIRRRRLWRISSAA